MDDKQGEGRHLEGLEVEWLGTDDADFYGDDEEGADDEFEVEEGAHKVPGLHE